MRFKQKGWKVVPGNIKKANLGFNNLVMTRVVSTDASMSSNPVPELRLGRIARAKARKELGQQPPGDTGSRWNLKSNRKADIEPSAKSYMAIVNIYEEAVTRRKKAPKSGKPFAKVSGTPGEGKKPVNVVQDTSEEKGKGKREAIRKTREESAVEQRKKVDEIISQKEYGKEANLVHEAGVGGKYPGKLIQARISGGVQLPPKDGKIITPKEAKERLKTGETIYYTGAQSVGFRFYFVPPTKKQLAMKWRLQKWRVR